MFKKFENISGMSMVLNIFRKDKPLRSYEEMLKKKKKRKDFSKWKETIDVM